MHNVNFKTYFRRSPLVRGEWIEMIGGTVRPCHRRMSPLVRGEWIEICTIKYKGVEYGVSPRERGVD